MRMPSSGKLLVIVGSFIIWLSGMVVLALVFNAINSK